MPKQVAKRTWVKVQKVVSMPFSALDDTGMQFYLDQGWRIQQIAVGPPDTEDPRTWAAVVLWRLEESEGAG